MKLNLAETAGERKVGSPSLVKCFLKGAVHRAGRWYVQKICESEASAQKFRTYNERPIEYGFALRAVAAHRPQTVLDVGTGTTAWPHLLRNCGCVVTAIDNVRDYWDAGMLNRHWLVRRHYLH